jgi:transcription initiation factor TFIID subunit 11
MDINFDAGFSSITSVRLSWNDLRRTGDMHSPSTLYERYDRSHFSYPFYAHICTQVIQQTLGQQVSMPVAQIVAGFSKVFVGEIIEKGWLSSLFSSSCLR